MPATFHSPLGRRRWPRLLTIQHGGAVRQALGQLLCILGLARLSGLGLSATTAFGTAQILGGLLLVGGLLLWFSCPYRLQMSGRIAAALAVGCVATVAYATRASTASALYVFIAVTGILEALSRRDYDC